MKKNLKRTAAAVLACAMLSSALPLPALANEEAAANTPLKIGTMSDTHYFSSALYGDNEDFTTAMNSDRKMFRESEAILDSALEDMVADAPDVVLVSGDLTKDGEQLNHEAFARKLTAARAELKKKGVDTQFYVINGNHDINNPHAKDYSSGQAVDTDRTTVQEFREIYKDFGYGDDTEAYAADSDRGGSLSYVAHPRDGYTLIAVDSGKYSADQTASGQDLQETGGVISDNLMNWVREKTAEAKKNGDVVMVMQHHGVVEHFTEEPSVMAEYLVDNYQNVQQAYADAGVSYVFTGHMHANDIAAYTSPLGNTLYDIETGSLVTYPSPTRRIRLTAGTPGSDLSSTMDIETKRIGAIDYTDPETGQKVDDLTAYGKKHTLSNEVVKTMLSGGLVNPMIDNILASGGSKAFVGQLLGIDPETADVSDALVHLLTTMLPASKADGFKLNIMGMTLSLYCDAESQQIRLSQLENADPALRTAADSREATLQIPAEDGTVQEITLPEALVNRLEEALAAQPQTMADNGNGVLELYIDTTTLKDTLLDPLFKDIDENVLSDKKALSAVTDTMVDALLGYKVDDTHTLFDLINTVYQGHLAGEETPEAWEEEAIEAIGTGGLLQNALAEAVDAAQPDLEKLLANVPLDLTNTVKPGNDGVMTLFVYYGVIAPIKNAGNILELFSRSDLMGMVPEDTLASVSGMVCSVADSMAHDTNYPEDNNTVITIERTVDEVILEAQKVLDRAKAINRSKYTDDSAAALETAVSALETAIGTRDKAAIRDRIQKVEAALSALTEKPAVSTPAQPGGNSETGGGQTASAQTGGSVSTGIEDGIAVAVTGLLMAAAAGGIFILRRRHRQ